MATRGLDGAVPGVATLCMAGVDFPREEERLAELVSGREWAAKTTVLNDTFAVLRAGTEQGYGVAVVCGAGINCVGVAPDGRHVRFPALGPITGDWGGGYDVGLAAVSQAARSFDGRGAKTTLEQAVPAHFGFGTPYELAEAIHAKGDRPGVACSSCARRVRGGRGRRGGGRDRRPAGRRGRRAGGHCPDRLGLDGGEVEVLLGGGLLQGENSRVVERIRAGLPGVTVRVTGSPPIVGAALLALDELGANGDAQARVRSELSEVVDG